MKRILAIGILLFIFVTLLHFLYTAFTGGSKESLLAHLFLLMDNQSNQKGIKKRYGF